MKLKASIAACLALASIASASGITLYEDIQTKQIFTEPGENRQKLGSFIQENNVAELMSKEVKGIPVTSKAKSLEFSGTHYFGFSSNSYSANNGSGSSSASGFEFRRNYLQVKANLTDKDYFRVTLDAIKELEAAPTGSGMSSGYSGAFVKYAYLYLDNILPYTSAEIGVAHRPWIDYEEHNGWFYRSFNKVLVEDKFSCYQATSGSSTATCVGPDIINSADLGVNFKTKTDYFTSELGIFNGEGYHADKNAANQQGSNDGQLSYEWRLTGHILGDGKKVGKYDLTKDEYAHISFAGMSSKNHKDNNLVPGDTSEIDRDGYWFHAVYNHPMFLIAGQWGEIKDKARNIPTTNDATSKTMNVWSLNGEFRPVKDWTIIARYDDLKTKYPNVPDTNANNAKDKGDANQWIGAVAYKYSKNINFIASYKQVDAKESTAATPGLSVAKTVGDQLDKKTMMFTTEVKW